MKRFTERQERLLHQLPPSVHALLITNPVNVTYLTGFTGDSSFCLLHRERRFLLSDTRYEQQITEECSDLEVVIRSHDRTTWQALSATLKQLHVSGLAVEGNHLTIQHFDWLQEELPSCSFVSLLGSVEALRAIKDEDEIQEIRQALKSAESCWQQLLPQISRDKTEKQLTDLIEQLVRQAGAESTSFSPIAAIGERAALPHAPPTSRTLDSGAMILFDWGAKCLYRSDLTRTVINPFCSEASVVIPPKNFHELYEAVRRSQEAAAAAVRPGVSCRDVDRRAREILETEGLNQFFTHGLGHGIGLDIHEAPAVRENTQDILQAGMMITLEPGVYIPGWGGIRLEDDFLVTAEGCERLSSLPHDPAAIQ